MHFQPQQYSAIIKVDYDLSWISPPFIEKKRLSSESVTSTEIHLERPIKNFSTANGLRDYLLMQYYFMALNNFYDILKKINEGSLDIKSKEQVKDKVITKLKTMAFLKNDNPVLLRYFVHTYWLFFGVEESSDFFIDYFKDTKVEKLILKDYSLFSKWNTDKIQLINVIERTYLKRMQSEGKWGAYKNASFVLFLLAELHGHKDASAMQSKYKQATNEFEKKTGIDPNQSQFQRHTDRKSKDSYYQHHKDKKK
jgi:hypothetical protein